MQQDICNYSAGLDENESSMQLEKANNQQVLKHATTNKKKYQHNIFFEYS